MRLSEAQALINAIISIRNSANDKDASSSVALYPRLKEDGKLIKAGTRINFKGCLFRSANDLWDTKENNPDNAPVLWEKVMYKNGYRIIPEVITAGASFSLNECGWWNNELYISLKDANIHTPSQYPLSWELVNIS